MKSRAIVFAVAMVGIVLAAWLGSSRTADPPAVRNVVFISVDTLRADHLGSYGYDRSTSPNIDSLARQGTLFENVSAQRGLTWPSLSSIMTSLYPVTHSVRANGQMLPAEYIQLAEIFQQDGYATAAFLANCHQQQWKGFDQVEHGHEREMTTGAIQWIGQHAREPFFVWLHLFAPHWPYQPPAPFDTQFDQNYKGIIDGTDSAYLLAVRSQGLLAPEDVDHIVSLYDGEIVYADTLVGEVMDALDTAGLRGDTLVILTSDHGEDLYDHNRYWDHRSSIYQSVLHIPLLFRAPGKIPAGRRIPTVAQSIEIAPTILAIVDLPVPAAFTGTPLSFDSGQALDARGPAFAEWEDRILSVWSGSHHYIHNPAHFDPRMRGGGTVQSYSIDTVELYDLTNDPGESKNIAREDPDTLRDLQGAAEAWQSTWVWRLNKTPYELPELPDHLKQELQALGYFGEVDSDGHN